MFFTAETRRGMRIEDRGWRIEGGANIEHPTSKGTDGEEFLGIFRAG
jgi:hypothetical protein